MLRPAQWSETGRSRAVVASGILFATLMIALCALSLYESRQDAVDHTNDSLRAIALIAERDITRNLEIYTLSLQGVIDGLAQPAVMALSPHLRRLALFDRSSAAEYITATLVLDHLGNIVLDSNSDAPRIGNFADRDYFTVHREHADVGTFISAPFRARLRGGMPSIALSRRLSHPDGSFAGIVILSLRLSYFSNLFAGLSLGPHSALTLLNTSGVIIMHQPNRPELIGNTYNHTALYRKFSAGESGIYSATSDIDGLLRFYAYRRLANVPLVVVVGAAKVDVYANWKRRAWVIGSLMLTLGAGFVCLSFMLSEQLRRRLRAEAGLRHLARTDGLTGLDNRRTLGEVLDAEWRRAQRTRLGFSLLFVDLDYFKAYNDRYGHQAGDEALTAVANCLRGHLRHAVDHAARYGGEEFLIILPDTDDAGASVTATKLLRAIRDLTIVHGDSPYGRITASIGTTSWCGEDVLHENAETGIRVMIKAADDALYRAKAGGRNRAMSALNGTPLPLAPTG
ncbi:MAG: sensor domain-containing diguanylate cyclase [Janthinobacterium lividum]